MKLRVLSENPITVMEFKLIIDLVKLSKSLEMDIHKMFPTRYKGVFHKGKKVLVVYLDKKEASSHKYEMVIN